jgi:hypothetical protein
MATRTRRNPEQLFLLDSRRFPKRVTLDARTRQIGLAGVAAARAALAAQAARRAEADTRPIVRPNRRAA